MYSSGSPEGSSDSSGNPRGQLTVRPLYISGATQTTLAYTPSLLLIARFRYGSMLCKCRVEAVYQCMTITVYDNS